MLLIIELLFLVAGLWAIISGKIPASLFKVLFGKGEYELSPNQTRLFGLFLSSPLPVFFFVSLLLNALGAKHTSYDNVKDILYDNINIFEIIYVFTIIVTSIIVAMIARRHETEKIDNSLSLSGYLRLLPIIAGILAWVLALVLVFGIAESNGINLYDERYLSLTRCLGGCGVPLVVSFVAFYLTRRWLIGKLK